jgi:hypothetical protein
MLLRAIEPPDDLDRTSLRPAGPDESRAGSIDDPDGLLRPVPGGGSESDHE